ncbi:MAG: AAA family ATPase, partial [Clostridia bacterium]|nr:AAA family ATPase [Clostridia bacterium]
MYFKGMELAGFKSFADKVEIKFDDGITAIVGPNGCGKSNVGDAIKWVLGEQSSKSLRGTSMQDVIFSGTEKRKSLSYCEVSLFFNNTDRLFNFEYDDIIVTRKLYRSGESEYLINRNPCRLKDIVNLFFDSGIGRDGYSIISQGKVEEIISSKPEQRRLIFEEAAGIAKFKSQKVESERKLERTEENLTRLRDIVGELDRQLGPLRKQAETAKIYLELRDVLKSLEVNAFIYQTENVDAKKAVLEERMNGLLQEISLKEGEMVRLGAQSSDCLENISKLDETMKNLNNEILHLTVGLEKQAGETNLLKERISGIEIQNQTLETELLNANNLILRSEAELKDKFERKTQLEKLAESIAENSGDSENLLSSYNQMKQKETDLNVSIRTLQAETTELYSTVLVQENRRRMLVEYQQEYEGFAFAVKKILKDAETDSSLRSKFIGVLAHLVQVEDKFETAIEVALGGALQNIVTETDQQAKDLIAYLKANRYGRATFMPVNVMKPRFLSAADKNLLTVEGCYGIASDLIRFDKKIENIVCNLLGNVVIAENLDIATSLAKHSNFRFRIVTLE